MKKEKLQLSLDDLAVATFETEDAEKARGTVEAQEMVTGNYPTCTTCWMTRVNTCCTP